MHYNSYDDALNSSQWRHIAAQKILQTIVKVDCGLLSAQDGNVLQTFNVSHGNSTTELRIFAVPLLNDLITANAKSSRDGNRSRFARLYVNI